MYATRLEYIRLMINQKKSMKIISCFLILVTMSFLFSCQKEKDCTDPLALNFNQDAERDCCCEFDGFISLYTRSGFGNGGIHIYIDSAYITEMSEIYIASEDPSYDVIGHSLENTFFLDDGSHYFECVQSDSVIASGMVITSKNSSQYIEVN